MTAKILGTEKDPCSVNALENYAKKYIFHPNISFNIRFYSIKCHIQVLFGARKFFSVLFGGKSPFLSLVGPVINAVFFSLYIFYLTLPEVTTESVICYHEI